ncbi:MAG: tetratricopeptide repeat protein [Magnetovibrio sp.]|nr:tetratricopeptide repeat protein [Magnetovibrio sp.]
MNRAERRRQQKKAKTAAKPRALTGQASPQLQADIEAGIALHQGGQLDAARQHYQAILKSHPNNAVVLNLMGALETQTGNLEAALDFTAHAIQAQPDFAHAHISRGNALKALNRIDDAIRSYQTAITLLPDDANAHFNLGTTLTSCGRNDDALTTLKTAVGLNPNFAEAHNNLGNVLHNLGRPVEAITAYHHALKLNPNYAEAHNNLGHVLQELEQFMEARTALRSALQLNPNYGVAHKNMALTLTSLGQLDAAILHGRRAVELDPNMAEGHNVLGTILQAQGALDEAKASYRHAIAVAPHFGTAHRHLSALIKHTEVDNDIKAMADEIVKPGLSDEQKMHFAFGLGKAYDDLKDADTAFTYFAQGNALKRARCGHSPDDSKAFFEAIKSVFDPAFFERHTDASLDDNTPIFILGMPRSGTSLVEQILASHPDVFGAGELNTLAQLVSNHTTQTAQQDVPTGLKNITDGDLKSIATSYLSELRKMDTNARFITDKMPENYFNVGLIKTILPNAKIIHCRRDPVDTSLSIFRTLFTGGGHTYAYDLADIGHQHNLYSDLMAHWDTVCPDYGYAIDYEALIADTEVEVRTLLEYCGLSWNDACLNFSTTKRVVQTASVAQVRQPIYNSSVKAWKAYEKHLGPLLNALNSN